MPQAPVVVLAATLSALFSCQPAPTMPETIPARPPVAAKEDHPIAAHGHVRNDPYHWMRLTEEQRKAPVPDDHTRRVVDHLRAENTYTEAVLAPLAPLREQLFKEMRGRIKETDMSVPFRENGHWYHYRFEEGREYPVHVWRKDEPGAPEMDLLDENRLAEGSAYFDLGDYEVSPGNNVLAYGVDRVGRRQYELRFRDLTTGLDLPDAIPHTDGGCAFADDRTVFYVRKDKLLRNHRVVRHVLGTDPATDVVVFEEKDPAFSCDVYRSRSDHMLIIVTESTMSSEYHYLPVRDPLGAFRVFLPREQEHEHTAMHVPAHDGRPAKWYIVTNWQARNFRLMECAEGDTRDKARWKEVLPHRDDVLLEDVDVFKHHLVFSERRNGLTHLRIRRLADGHEHEIAFNDPAYMAYTGTNPEWDTAVLRYGYTSMTTPSSVYEHRLDGTGTDVLLKQQEVLGGFDPGMYVSERLHVPAHDGARVPVSIVYHKDTPINGTAPLLLYGYGSYGYSLDPGFSSARLSLLDRGFVYAIAHVRGGEELGRAWYEHGRMEHKQNTFTDFIDCADHLVRNGHAHPDRVCAMGGSAGGLLMGAVVNMRPDRWKAVVAEVPFVDVVTTMLDESIPLTTGEFDEWGDPKEKAAYERMLSYSPYDNVRDAAHPAMLVTTGLHDSQVQYWEPAKWVQRLRAHQRGDAPVLLYTNLDAGHGGASGRFQRLKEVALDYAFLLWQAGIGP
jgi:oligopeptidase B